MIDGAWVVALVVIGLGSLVFGISIGRTLGYCDRLVEEIDEILDRNDPSC